MMLFEGEGEEGERRSRRIGLRDTLIEVGFVVQGLCAHAAMGLWGF
jgi:hypothetical protein